MSGRNMLLVTMSQSYIHRTEEDLLVLL